MDSLMPGLKIGEVHGQTQTIPTSVATRTVLPLYHPAAALYNRSLRQTLLEDFAKIPQILETI